MKVVIPIAGRGSRFKSEADRNSEYARPKPFIGVRGLPMVRWATGSLPFIAHADRPTPQTDFVLTGSDLVFVALDEHEEEYGISEQLQSIYGPDVNVVLIPEVTRGAAETVYQAKDLVDDDEALIVSDSDHFFDGQPLYQAIVDNPDIAGLIPVFHVPEKDPKWSFSKTGEDGYVEQVAEKVPISEWANIGAYYFGKSGDFFDAVADTISKNELTNGEFYVAPVYNKLLARDKKIKLVYPDYVHGLGTPADLESFLENTEYQL